MVKTKEKTFKIPRYNYFKSKISQTIFEIIKYVFNHVTLKQFTTHNFFCFVLVNYRAYSLTN